MQLDKLLHAVESAELVGASTVDVTSIEINSKLCQKGALFAAYQGIQSDGRDYIIDAIERGTSVVLTDEEHGFRVEDYPDVSFVFHPQPRFIVALLLRVFYHHKPKNIALVTGTNGKTSVAYYTSEIWSLLGKKSASIGTLGVMLEGEKEGAAVTNLTTPDVVTLHKALYNMAQQDIDHVIIEASSHGLLLDRLTGIEANIVSWTNITRDHLDFHGEYSHYLEAKCRIFNYLTPEDGVAILNADVDEYDMLTEFCEALDVPWLSYGYDASGLRIQNIHPTAQGQEVAFTYRHNNYKVQVPLMGKFQIYNVMCAVGIVLASGEEIQDILAVLPKLTSVPGRMEWVTTTEKTQSPVIVDYAHTPDALETVLSSVKEYTQELGGKTVLVFGCGGDRDKGKRPLMGAVAAQLADIVVVTDDNPRKENPDQIRKEIIVNCAGCFQEADRKKAIAYGLDMLTKNDVLVVAGKGHEKYQIIGEDTFPFDDVEVIKELTCG